MRSPCSTRGSLPLLVHRGHAVVLAGTIERSVADDRVLADEPPVSTQRLPRNTSRDRGAQTRIAITAPSRPRFPYRVIPAAPLPVARGVSEASQSCALSPTGCPAGAQ
jgi:hypothetical protein